MEASPQSGQIGDWEGDNDEMSTLPRNTIVESDDSEPELIIPESIPAISADPAPLLSADGQVEQINGNLNSRIDTFPPPRLRRHSSTNYFHLKFNFFFVF